MHHRRLLRCSLALNLLFLGVGGWFLAEKPTDSPQAAPAIPETSAAAGRAADAPFRWSQLEAADYPTYIANLRAIRCPEETIRDIITADVASQYAEQRRQLVAANMPSTGSSTSAPDTAAARGSGATKPPREMSVAGENAALSQSAEPTMPTRRDLDREQANLLASLLPNPAASITPQVPAAPLPANASVNPPMPQPRSKAPKAINYASANAESEEPTIRLLTHEQEVLRARVGWQAFYFTTKEENDQARAAAQGQ